jgi:hypothetical protein
LVMDAIAATRSRQAAMIAPPRKPENQGVKIDEGLALPFRKKGALLV